MSQIPRIEGGDDNNKISCLYRIGPLTGSPEILTPQRATITGWGGGGREGVGVVETYNTEGLLSSPGFKMIRGTKLMIAGWGLLLHLFNLSCDWELLGGK